MAIISSTWNVLSSLRCWTPVADVGIPLTSLRDGLLAAGGGYYLLTSPDLVLKSGDPRAPCATVALWAASDGGAIRAALGQVADDDEELSAAPPAEVTQGRKDISYAVIIREAREKGASADEHAEYSGTNGQFIHKTIVIAEWSYYFRQTRISPKEIPYAISKRLAR